MVTFDALSHNFLRQHHNHYILIREVAHSIVNLG